MSKIDILMATYNGEKFISEQMESLLNQSNRNWQLIVRDDGSSDSTLEIVERYAKAYSGKIKIVKDGKKGLGARDNFLELLKHSKAPYVMFCDQDDYWLSGKIEVTLKKMREVEKAGVPTLIHTDLKVVDENLKIMGESFWNYQNINPDIKGTNRLVVQNNVTGCTMMINSSLRDKIVGRDFSNSVMHDWVIAILASILGEIYYLNEQTMLYRQHGSNDTGAKKWGLGYITSKLQNNFGRELVLKTQRQCNDIVSNYEVSRELIQYVHLHEKSYPARVHWCLKHLFIKDGIFKNIIFLSLI